MLAPSPPPRMIICTLRAWPDRNTAAWPAELPPPTSTTSWPAHSLASIGEAQYQTPRPSKASRLSISRPPVARPARHHDGSARTDCRRQSIASANAPSRCEQSSDLTATGIMHLGAEFLRLDEGAAGQRLPGNAGRKAQIVFDARAGAGLAAERARIEHRHRQPFGGGIDRGRETGGTAADHRHVVELLDAPGWRSCRAASASRVSAGLRSTVPSGHTTSGRSAREGE